MSNLVHRRRRCARIVLHSILCLEGSTPEDRSGTDTQTAPVGRCMCGIPYPGCRFALPWAKCLLPFQGAYHGRMMRGQGTLHQAKDIVVAPGEPFCTAKGCYFVFCGLRRSCKAGLGVAAQGCCQDASCAETYDGRSKAVRLLSPQKLFDLFLPHQRIRSIRLIRGKEEKEDSCRPTCR